MTASFLSWLGWARTLPGGYLVASSRSWGHGWHGEPEGPLHIWLVIWNHPLPTHGGLSGACPSPTAVVPFSVLTLDRGSLLKAHAAETRCRREDALSLEARGFRNIRLVQCLTCCKNILLRLNPVWHFCERCGFGVLHLGRTDRFLHSKRKSKCFARNILLPIKVTYFLSVMQSMCWKWESLVEDSFQMQ